MITNLLATIVISVITNWTPVYEQIPMSNIFPCSDGLFNNFFLPNQMKQGKYLGEDGIVVKVTEIKFDYEDKLQVHRIEEPLERIERRCTEKPPVEPEKIWKPEKRIPIINE